LDRRAFGSNQTVEKIKMKDNLTGVTVKRNSFYIDGEKKQLAGNHTWNTVQAIDGELIGINKITGNFTRLWTIETRGAVFAGSPWGSNTPGVVKIDDVPWRKDKSGRLNRGYYDALERAVKAADEQGIIVGVCLFEGAIVPYFPKGGNSWRLHPFNGMKDGPKEPWQVHSRGPWNKHQRAHVKEVTSRLEKYNNVIYEVGNELNRKSIKWFQGKVIEWVKEFTDKPVGASYATGMKPSKGRTQDWLTKIDADWIAPSGPAKLPGFKGPQILDTDHAWPLRSNVTGLQNAWDDGRSVWVMDGFKGTMLRNQESLQRDRNWIDTVT
jgi:hypothetical protein